MAEENAGDSSASTTESPRSDVPVIYVRGLLGESREAVLIYEGEHYRLRITAKNRLILTK